MPETITVPAAVADERIDAFLHRVRPDLSRSRWQQLIKDGFVRLDNAQCKPSTVLKGAESIAFDIPPPSETELVPEDIPLDILYEDEHILVVNKQPGIVVHPAPGHPAGTLVNAILNHCGDLKGIGGERRPGIVHRLDKDTSGVLVAAKTGQSMENIARQFKSRSTQKEYLALVWGVPQPKSGTIETEIGRSRHDRKKMSVVTAKGRHAVTHYKTMENFNVCSVQEIEIETGRTHQIRVHMAHIQHPVLGDATYGSKLDRSFYLEIPRQMLHAHRLVFTHPASKQLIETTAPLPDDMRKLIHTLRNSTSPET